MFFSYTVYLTESPILIFKGDVQRDVRGSQVVSIDRYSFKDVPIDIFYYLSHPKYIIFIYNKKYPAAVNTKKWAFLSAGPPAKNNL